MSKFSPEELRRAAAALKVINERGDPDEWGDIQRKARAVAAAGGWWNSATAGQRLTGQRLAADLAALLGESRELCEQAAAEVSVWLPHRAMFDAILGYAAELTGQPMQRTSSAAAKPTATVRLVAEERAVR